MNNLRGRVVALLLMSMPALSAEAGDAAEAALDSITVVATGVSNMIAASAGDVSQTQMASQPLLRPAAILENIPGLIVTQHSGEGKANQYFLRAFNLDHGTDLALEVDDMPVNMPSHAHGQG
jgi:outer membrane receptor for Fe3+-dicitrate